jgi:hypothetical protein
LHHHAQLNVFPLKSLPDLGYAHFCLMALCTILLVLEFCLILIDLESCLLGTGLPWKLCMFPECWKHLHCFQQSSPVLNHF